MTIFFNFDNLIKEAKNDTRRFLSLLNILYHKKLPSKKSGIRIINSNLNGKSYILNLKDILEVANTVDSSYIIQYVELCSKRDYNLYRLYNYKNLQLSMYPDLNLEVIKHNPLLNITNTEIQFKYE